MSGSLNKIFAPVPVTERGRPIHIGGGFTGDNKSVAKITYAAGKSVFIRETENPINTYQYKEHKSDVTISRLSPSGFYCFSCDVSGKILVWDTVGEDHVIKLEKASIGKLYDGAWSPDSQRIVVGGEGRERFGEAFMLSGASVGEITGHNKPILGVAFKQSRPFRVATGSEDFKVNVFPGPPFKFQGSQTAHQRYVNAVRFSPDGSVLLSVGSDKQGIFYDGKTGEPNGVKLAAEHKGSIYDASFSPDSKRVLTVSGDKTAKIWDVATGACEKTFTFPNEVAFQQLGCLWQGEDLITINLDGAISFLNEEDVAAPKRVIHGHNKSITAFAYDSANDRIYTGDSGSKIVQWDPTNSATAVLTGKKAHTSGVTGATVSNGALVTISVDDTVKFTPTSTLEYVEGVKLDSQPRTIASRGDIVVVGTVDSVIVMQDGKILSTLAIKFSSSAIAIAGDEVAVGGDDNIVHVYTLANGSLTAKHALESHRGTITALDYSPDGTYLAVGDSNREIKVYKGTESVVNGWVFHNASVSSLSWAPDSLHLASGSIDMQIIVWNVASPNSRITIKQTHNGGVKNVQFLSQDTVLSVGADLTMKTWTITY
eukprot:TRINITY_DN5240_c0_g1_i1.p1 TRINITY_DN5240_c0_g1~~TRINITY_DN5240_c0_g1_i1.p1  ORF type:complete len:598 (+),score=135.16 TRINITY_DN5240_c0_g1_i1:322-2115(+)